jgi:hypothetical protein
MGLVEKAAALAADPAAFRNGQSPAVLDAQDQAPLMDFDVPDPDPNGYEQIPALLAWLRVRADIKSIAKERVFAGQNWKFRGIDEALNAFGPVTLRHGVNVVPHRIRPTFRDAHTSQGKPTRECTITTTWRIYGPMYDFFEAETVGESLDSGDRGSSKAQSVARRELLFGVGLIPTGDPDGDVSTIERGEAPVRSAASYLGEIFDENTSPNRMNQIVFELRQTKQHAALVRNERGQDEPIGALVTRIGNDRFGDPQQQRAAKLASEQREGAPDESEYSAEASAAQDRRLAAES